jgi:hypothetical protein
VLPEQNFRDNRCLHVPYLDFIAILCSLCKLEESENTSTQDDAAAAAGQHDDDDGAATIYEQKRGKEKKL